MVRCILSSLCVAVCGILAAAVSGTGNSRPANYQPVLLSNGRLTVTLNNLGGVDAAPQTQRISIKTVAPGIYRTGRRLNAPRYSLYGHGSFRLAFSVDGKKVDKPDAWTQYLDVDRAASGVTNVFGDVTRTTEAFVAVDENTLALRQTFSSRRACEIEVSLEYSVPSDPCLEGGKWTENADGSRVYSFKAYGLKIVSSQIKIRGGCARFRLRPGDVKTVDAFLSFEDSLDMKKGVAAYSDWNSLLAHHVESWNRYHGESHLSVPDGRIMGMWKMANYHLKCNCTEWSIPVGLFPSHWHGMIFAFDEMYAVQGLVSSGHFKEARIAPEYRIKTLPDAMRRCKNRNKRHFGYGARWVWQGMEDLVMEGAPPGFWLDHIFHMSAIAQSCWVVYQYMGDDAYLRDVAYPVMRECARFYRSQAVVESPLEGGAFIAPCTDLERLGPGRVRPFMTTCGAMHTFRSAAAAAKLLGQDLEEAADLMATASRLERLLPQAEGRFIPSAEDAGAVSMGTLAGYFPFPVFPRGHALQRESVRFFLDKGVKGGNMYSTGRLICPWYAATMSIAALHSGVGKMPIEYLYDASRSAGCWGEFWEINEPGVAEYRPWFMTAAGNCLYAINQLFVSNQDGELRLCCGVPEAWKDYSFRLPAHGGVTVDCQVVDGSFRRLVLKTSSPSKDKKATLRFRDGKSQSVTLDQFNTEIY